MRRSYFGSTTQSPAAGLTLYNILHLSENSVWGSADQVTRFYLPEDCVVSDFAVTQQVANGAGQSRTYYVYKNHTTDTLSVQLADAATSGIDYGSYDFVAGDSIELKCTSSAAPAAATKIAVSFNITTKNKRYFVTTSKNQNMPTTTTRQYALIESGRTEGLFGATESQLMRWYCAHAGRIKKIIYNISAAAGAGKSYEYSVYKNGAQEATSIYTFTGTTDKHATLDVDIPFSIGDYLEYSAVAAGTPTTHRPQMTMSIEPDVDGESNLAAATGTVSTSATSWAKAIYLGVATVTTSETSSLQFVGRFGFTLKTFYIKQTAATGNAISRSWKWRKNGADANNLITISGGVDTTGSDLASIDTYVEGDSISIETTRTGNTNALKANAYCVMFCPPVSQGSFIT